MCSPTPLSISIAFGSRLISRSPLRRGFPVVLLALGLFALSPTARAVNPPPDGGYANGNTAEGTDSLFNLTSGPFGGFGNTADGYEALFSDTTGSDNTGTGFDTLNLNTTGSDNTANGYFALANNTTGSDNTATGSDALSNNTTGGFNTASGNCALFSNTAGSANTATGLAALGANTTGHDNTANGVDALFLNTTGRRNTADGSHALFNNATGSNNIALGNNAGSLVTGSNNIDIGAQGAAGESGVIRIGMSSTATGTFIAGISGKTVAAGVGVIINPKGQVGTVQSSARFKDNIKPMDKASEAILFLQPVTFRYKHDLDPDRIPQFGLVAEQVEKVNPDLVVRGEDGKVMTVRYEAVNAMLLNEFLKEHRKVEEQAGEIAQMKKQIEALTATVQKVSEQVLLSEPVPQFATNP